MRALLSGASLVLLIAAGAAAAQDTLHPNTLRADPQGLASSVTTDAPGLMNEEAPLQYAACVAAAPGVVLRSDIVPLAGQSLRTIERRWSAYLLSRLPTVVGPRCEKAHAPGKSAAYYDLDNRVFLLRRQSGAGETRFTGWRG